jgi:glyoxylase-like metal-dependent hydrolase (beta-lactamase superfamily II)
MTTSFASAEDTEEREITFSEIGDGLYGFTADGDPNSGVIVGDDCAMVIDTQATPVAAKTVLECIRSVTDKPVRYVVLSHYHAVRVLGAAAYGAEQIVCSERCRAMIFERGEEDWESEYRRLPRLFKDPDSIPGLTYPTVSFPEKMTVYLGKRRVDLMHLGRAHTAGDIVAWVPDSRALFSGDIVEYMSACSCGDGHFQAWMKTLDRIAALGPEVLVPGRGEALGSLEKSLEAIKLTRTFLEDHFAPVKQVVDRGGSLLDAYRRCKQECDPKYVNYNIYSHCLPFNVARAYDEANGIDMPRIWTAERDQSIWSLLQNG